MLSLLIYFLVVSSPVDYGETYIKATKLLENGEHKEASELFTLLSKDKKCPLRYESMLRLCEIKILEGKPDSALKELEKLVKKVKGTYLEPEVLLALAEVHLVMGNLEEAERILGVLQRYPTYKKDERFLRIKGALFYRRRAYNDALSILERREDPVSLLLLTRLYTKLKSYENAIISARMSRERSNSSFEKGCSRFLEAEALYKYGDYKGVLVALSDFKKDFPDHPVLPFAQFLIALSYFKLGEYTDALPIFSSLTSSNFPLSPEAAYFAGISSYNLGDFDGAIGYFQKVKSYSPGSPLALFSSYEMAKAYIKMGREREAFSIASQFESIRLSPSWEGIGSYLSAVLYLYVGKEKKAQEKFMELVENHPDSPFKEAALALLLGSINREGDYERSVAFGHVFLKEIKSFSFWAGLFKLYLADALYYTGHLEEAQNLYTDVFQNYKIKRLLLYAEEGLAWAYLNEGRDKEALKLFEALEGVTSEDTSFIISTHMGYGVAAFNVGDYELALKHFAALELTFPELVKTVPELLYYKGLTYYALKYYGDAVKAWEDMISYFPNSSLTVEAAKRAGETYYMAGEYTKALNIFNWLLDHHPDYPETPRIVFLIGMSYYNMKNFDEALKIFENFITKYPDHPLVGEAKRRLEYTLYAMSLEKPESSEEFEKKFPRSHLAAESMFFKAAKLYENKKLKEAADLFFKMALGFPDHEKAPQALLYAGQIYSSLSMWKEAALAYKKLVDFYPDAKDRPKALLGLGIAYYNLKMYSEARNAFEEVIDSYSGTDEYRVALKNLGLTYLKLEEVEGAVPVLKEAASLFEEENDSSNALLLYKYLLQIAPDPKTRDFALSKIHQLEKKKGEVKRE